MRSFGVWDGDTLQDWLAKLEGLGCDCYHEATMVGEVCQICQHQRLAAFPVLLQAAKDLLDGKEPHIE